MLRLQKALSGSRLLGSSHGDSERFDKRQGLSPHSALGLAFERSHDQLVVSVSLSALLLYDGISPHFPLHELFLKLFGLPNILFLISDADYQWQLLRLNLFE